MMEYSGYGNMEVSFSLQSWVGSDICVKHFTVKNGNPKKII